MSIIVKKFGGTSVGSIELIQNIAKKIANEYRDDQSLVLVVSAMAKTTDDLVNLANAISTHPSRRELDMLLTAGERISMALLSLALQEYGLTSISFTGSQSGIKTDNKHGNARILNVNAYRIREELEKGKIVIVAGFQGVSPQNEITTLGRGGSDTSAVALACYLKALSCEIYTDVDGVFTSDPRIVPDARLISEIDYAQMLALSYNGSKVMHPRSIEFAVKYNIPVEVKNSLTFAPGTTIHNEIDTKDKNMEEHKVTAIAHKDNLLRYILAKDSILIESLKSWNNEIFKYFAEGDQIELFIENKYEKELNYYLESCKIKVKSIEHDLGYVTMVGMGINLDLSLLASTLQVCKPFAIQRIQHSDMTIELMLPSANVHACLQALHDAFIGEEK